MHPHSLAICISLRKLHLISLKPGLSRLHTHKLFYITSRNLSCCINNMINLSYLYFTFTYIENRKYQTLLQIPLSAASIYRNCLYSTFYYSTNIRRKSCIFVGHGIFRISAIMPHWLPCLIRYPAFFCYEIHIAGECGCMSELEERVCTEA